MEDGTGPLGLDLVGGSLDLPNSTFGDDYSGDTTINGGTLQLQASDGDECDGGYGVGYGALHMLDGATLDLNGSWLDVEGGFCGSYDSTITNSSSNAATLDLENFGDDSWSFYGVIQDGAGSVGTYVNSGEVNLSGTNTYSGGTDIQDGATLQAGSSQALGVGGVVIEEGGTLDLNGQRLDISASLEDLGLITNTSYYPATLVVGYSDWGSDGSFGGVIQDGFSGYGKTTLELDSGSLDLNGANTYTGGTNIVGGTLFVSNGSALGYGPLTVGADGTLDLNGYSPSVRYLNGDAGAVITSSTSGGTLIVGNADYPGDSGAYAGLIEDGDGTTALRLNGGTLLLTGANTYSGGTVVYGGSLIAGNSTGSATGSGTVTLNGGLLGSTASGGSIGGTVIAGSSAHIIEPGGATVGNLTLGGLTTNSHTTLKFNFGVGTSSLLTVSSEISITVSTIIQIAVGNTPLTAGFYKIITGTLTGLTTGSFGGASSSGDYNYTINTTHDSGYIDLSTLPDVDHTCTCSCQTTTNEDGSLLTNMATIAGEANSAARTPRARISSRPSPAELTVVRFRRRHLLKTARSRSGTGRAPSRP